MNDRSRFFPALVVSVLVLGLMVSAAVAGPGVAGAESNPFSSSMGKIPMPACWSMKWSSLTLDRQMPRP